MKRAAHKARQREQLIAEARALFSEQGYECTTVADIVRKCGIGRGTFYNYFADVKAVFDAVLDEVNCEVKTISREAKKGAQNLYDLYYRSFKAYFDFVSSKEMIQFHKKNQVYIRSITYTSPSLLELVRDIQHDLQHIKGKGHFQTDMEHEFLSYMFVGAPTELFLNIMTIQSKIDTDAVASFLAKLFTKGLGMSDQEMQIEP